MLSVLIFDFDGTLVQSNEIKHTAFKRLFKDHPEHADQMLQYHFAHNAKSRFEKFEYYASELLGLKGADKKNQINQWAERYQTLTRRAIIDCPWVDGAQEFIHEMASKLPLYIVSATPQEDLDFIIDARGLRPFFQGVYGKPTSKEDNVEQIIRKERVDRKRVLMVGDSPEDAQTARKMQIGFVGILSGLTEFEGETFPKFRTIREFSQAL